MSAEQQARDMLEAMGYEDAQQRTAGDVVFLANLIRRAERAEAERDEARALLRECMSCMSSLRYYVSEGGSRSMVGAIDAIREADAMYEAACAALAEGK